LAPYYKGLQDLHKFIDDKNWPQVPGGIEDFVKTQLDADGRFEDPKALYTLPYDCPTLIWIYRKDLFDKYGSKMQTDLGFDPIPSNKITWEQYCGHRSPDDLRLPGRPTVARPGPHPGRRQVTTP
jgi:multiple sugar transport system substrate-binding protein